MHLIRTGIVFGAGYVLGTKAGRERYDQIVASATLISERPEVKRVAEPVLSFFTSATTKSAAGHRAPTS